MWFFYFSLFSLTISKTDHANSLTVAPPHTAAMTNHLDVISSNGIISLYVL